jgi:hypothetical protein
MPEKRAGDGVKGQAFNAFLYIIILVELGGFWKVAF